MGDMKMKQRSTLQFYLHEQAESLRQKFLRALPVIVFKHKKRSQEARQIIQRYIYYADYVLNQIQEMMHLKKEKHLKSVEGMQYQRYIEGEPKFSELMALYAHNLSRLYARVLKKYQNPRSGNS